MSRRSTRSGRTASAGRTLRPALVLALAASAVVLGLCWRALDTGPQAEGVVRLAPDVRPAPLAPPSEPSVRETVSTLPVRTTSGAAEPDSEPVPRPKPHNERVWREVYEREAKERLQILEDNAIEILTGDAPSAQKVALIRTLYAQRSERAPEILGAAVRELPNESDAQGESVPSFVVRFLSEHAPRDVRARQVLENVAFELPAETPLGLRRRAAARLCAYADEAALSRIVERLELENDDLLVYGAYEALGRNPNGVLARELRARLAHRVPDPDSVGQDS